MQTVHETIVDVGGAHETEILVVYTRSFIAFLDATAAASTAEQRRRFFLRISVVVVGAVTDDSSSRKGQQQNAVSLSHARLRSRFLARCSDAVFMKIFYKLWIFIIFRK